jgi:hypothetical protein
MAFLLDEDKALRELLQGMVVHDQKADGSDTPRPVGVWFGQPDQELRNQVYPYITIDMVAISRDPQREMRGRTSAEYLTPDNLPEGMGWDIELPIPVNIDYQITTYARHPRHDRELLAQVLYQKLQLRFAQLNVGPNTVHRLEVLGVAKRDSTEQAKRLFTNAITVRVATEISQGVYSQYYKVQEVVPTATPQD